MTVEHLKSHPYRGMSISLCTVLLLKLFPAKKLTEQRRNETAATGRGSSESETAGKCWGNRLRFTSWMEGLKRDVPAWIVSVYEFGPDHILHL